MSPKMKKVSRSTLWRRKKKCNEPCPCIFHRAAILSEADECDCVYHTKAREIATLCCSFHADVSLQPTSSEVIFFSSNLKECHHAHQVLLLICYNSCVYLQQHSNELSQENANNFSMKDTGESSNDSVESTMSMVNISSNT